MCLEIHQLDTAKFLSVLGLAWQAALKKTEVKLELLVDIDMLLMFEKLIRGGICHSINRYAKANDKYMNDYDKNKESPYLKYQNINNLYGWAMSQKLPVNNFKWVEDISEVHESFIKSYNGESDEGCFLELNIQYPENVHNLQTDLPFLPERMKIEKVEKLVANLHDKTGYIIYLRNSKQALSHGLVLKKVYRVIKFNQKDLLKPYIDMNNKLGKKAKNDFEKDFSS